MTKKNEEKRDYNLADSDLLAKGTDLIDSVKRDATDLQKEGITPQKIADLEAAQKAFDDCKDDVFYQKDISITVEEKQTLRRDLELKLANVRTKAQNVYGADSAKYKQFGFGELSRHSDRELVEVAQNVVTVANLRLNDLKTEGLKATQIADITTNSNALATKIQEVSSKEKLRDIATQDRVSLGNKLFEKMMKITNTAKTFYRDKDEAKYNDYLVYDGFAVKNNNNDNTGNTNQEAKA